MDLYFQRKNSLDIINDQAGKMSEIITDLDLECVSFVFFCIPLCFF